MSYILSNRKFINDLVEKLLIGQYLVHLYIEYLSMIFNLFGHFKHIFQWY